MAANPFAAGLVGLVGTTTWLPRCVAIPPPDGLRTTLVDELAAVRAVPDAVFRAELETSLAHPHPRYAADPRRPRDLSFLTGQGWGAHRRCAARPVGGTHRPGVVPPPRLLSATSPTGPACSPPAAGLARWTR
ncbi:hypothetical protein O1L44_06365 [Streptomyces noursei]|nr:hypothetical protein [Streptomyces noursei]